MRQVLMCSPDFFAVRYSINPWMHVGSVDQEKAKMQWQQLVGTLQQLGVFVETISQVAEFPDMVFAADQGIVRDKSVVLSTFRYPERQGETTHYRQWFTENGYQIHHTKGYYEGGDLLAFQGEFFLGTGFRSQEESAIFLSQILSTQVHQLTLCDEHFYHLDTCLFPLDEKTAFYYPKAFSAASLQTLQQQIPTLIELTDDEAYGFSANALRVGDHVLISAGNQSFTKKINDLGYVPIAIDISEFIKAGGGIHCLVLCLQ